MCVYCADSLREGVISILIAIAVADGNNANGYRRQLLNIRKNLIAVGWSDDDLNRLANKIDLLARMSGGGYREVRKFSDKMWDKVKFHEGLSEVYPYIEEVI